jgi:hypothetical protein
MTFQILMGLIQIGRITIKSNGKPAMQSTAWRRFRRGFSGAGNGGYASLKCAAHEQRTTRKAFRESGRWLREPPRKSERIRQGSYTVF